MNGPGSRVSIRKWLSWLYAILAIAPLLVMGLAMSFMGTRYQLKTSEQIQLEISRRAKSEILFMSKSLEALLLGALRTHNPIGLSEDEQKVTLSNIRTHFKGTQYGDVINELILYDTIGDELASATRLDIYPEGHEFNWAETNPFRETLESGEPHYGHVFFNEATREPFITLNLPIHDIRHGGITGVLMAEIRLKHVWNSIKDISLDFGGTLYIVDQSGWVVAHPDSSVVLRGTSFSVPTGQGIRKGLSGRRVFLASESFKLGDLSFFLVTERPLGSALSLSISSIITTGVFFFVSLFGSIAFVYLIMRRIIRPVESLAETATAIGCGELSRKAIKEHDDEIGLLADTFNEMSKKLIDTISSLKQQIAVRIGTEDALASEKERLSVTLKSIGDGVIATDNQNRIVLMNEAAEALTGWPQARAFRQGLSDVYNLSEPRDINGTEGPANRHVLSSLDGQEKFVSHQRKPIRDQSGNAIGEIVVFRDVTDEVRFEEYISRQNKFLRSLLDSITHPLYVVDTSTLLVKVANSAAGFGLLTDKSTCYSLTHKRQKPCSGEEHPCTIREVLRTKGPVTLEHVHYDDNGELMYIEVHGYPIYDEDGSIFEVIEYTIDITSRKRQEEKLLRASSLEAIGKLAAGVAHEINTPLTNASLSMELLLSEGECVKKHQTDIKRLKSIERNIEKASKIAQELLWFSRQKEFELIAVDINSVIDSALVISEWMFRDIEVNKETQDVPFISGDPLKLEQAFINIISNAVEAMPEGGTMVIRTYLDDGKVVAEVSDTGVGIEEDNMDRLLEPFFTTKERGRGTGLGLSICSDIIEQHSGELTVTSRKGQGTVVKIILPPAPMVT